MKEKARRGIRVVVLVLLGLVLAGEIGLRLARFHIRFPTPCRWQQGTGCLLLPNLSEELAVGDSSHFTTNALGLRDPPRGPKSAGVRRVLVLGDSVAFGARVDDAETYPWLLNAHLQGERVEVINAASLYLKGTEQQLSWFVDNGAALQPDLVLLSFSLKNDFVDNTRHEFWRPGPQGLERVLDWKPPLTHRIVMATAGWPPVRWLDDHSRLFGIVRFLWLNILDRHRLDGDEPEATDQLLTALQEKAGKLGARLAIVAVPGPEELDHLRQHPGEPDTHEAFLVRSAAAHHIPLLDVTPSFLEASAPVEFRDGHLTPRGHALVADLVAPRLSGWLTGREAP
jgi:lysophospholipase L1-like esterase